MAKFMEFRQLKNLCVLVIIISIPLGGRAELPPSVYEDLQKKCPEALTIKVESVKIVTTDEASFKRLEIAAEAKVETVARSESGLKPGDTILINYTHLDYKQPIAGPSEPDILREGRSYPAFLSGVKDGVYTPAARGYSFRKVN